MSIYFYVHSIHPFHTPTQQGMLIVIILHFNYNLTRQWKISCLRKRTFNFFFFHWSPRYFYSHYPNVLDVLLCPPELACITRQRCMRMFSSRVASNTASTRGIQITFYNWLLSLMTLFLRCWLWWGSRKIIDHCRCFGAHFWNVATYCWCFLQCLCNSWEGNWTWVLVPCSSAITV